MEYMSIKQSLEVSKKNLAVIRGDSDEEHCRIEQEIKWTIFDFAHIKRPTATHHYKSPSFPVSIGLSTVTTIELSYAETGNWISLYVHIPTLNKYDRAKLSTTFTLGLMDAKDEFVEWSKKEFVLKEEAMVPGMSSTWGFLNFACRRAALPYCIGPDESFLNVLHWDDYPLVFFFQVSANITYIPPIQQPKPCILQLLTDLSNMYTSGEFSDVVFIVDNKRLNAHKCILSSRSAVFRAMFQRDFKEAATNIVHINDCHHQLFDSILKFIYSGKVDALEENAEELLALANKYELLNLKDICEEYLAAKLTVDNASQILLSAYLHDADLLKVATVGFIKSHMKEVRLSDGWQLLGVDQLNLIIDLLWQ